MRHANKDSLLQANLALRNRVLDSLEHIDDSRVQVPELEILNPPLWELGHIGWFQEHWCLRGGDLSQPSMMAGADELFNSTDVIHQRRWSLPLPDMRKTRAYVSNVFDLANEKLDSGEGSDDAMYFHRLSHFHEAMHLDAFLYSWQTIGYPRPAMLAPMPSLSSNHFELSIDATTVDPGSKQDAGFCFDNEKWSTPTPVAAFSIDAEPVTNGQFAQFVSDGGYENAAHWDSATFAQLEQSTEKNTPRLPRYWTKQGDTYLRRDFDKTAPLVDTHPMLNLSAFEAQAYCKWAGRRLPTEAEWIAASEDPCFRWRSIAWEWTASIFEPLPGFSADPYKEYSEPWFHTHRVVRGGSFATHPTLVQPNFRNFYLPERADPFFGFRTCALG